MEAADYRAVKTENTSAEESHPVDPSAEEEFWLASITRIALLGSSTWASMPVTFSLAWYGFDRGVYLFLMVKFIIVYAVQVIIRREIITWLREHRPETKEVEWLDEADKEWRQASESMRGMARQMIKMICFVVLLMEILDPDMDAMTPGNSRQALTDEQSEDFKNSWRTVPIVGPVVATVGLPGTLGLGMTGVSLYQIVLFARQVRRARTRVRSNVMFHDWVPYGVIMHIPDIAGLLPLAAFTRGLWVAQPGREDQGDRGMAYNARLFEMIFQTWFSTSVLVYTWGEPVSAVVPIIISIVTSYVASGVSICELLPHVQKISKAFGVFSILPQITLHIVFFTLITARIVGIWACSSHDLELLRLSCSP